MKNDIFKRIMALAIVVLMCVTLFACGTGKDKGATTGTVITTTAGTIDTSKEDATGATENVPDKSPIKLTIGVPTQNNTLGDGTHQEYPVFSEITAQTGVTLDLVTYDAEKFKVLAAGGDLPDLISITEGTYADTLISSGALLELDELLEKYGQNIIKNAPLAIKWSKQLVGNGKVYILPITVTAGNLSSPSVLGGFTFNTRYDIYKAIGSPKMSGEDDFLGVLKQMQDYQREATGNNKIYALSAWSDWGLWPYTFAYPYGNGFNLTDPNHLLNLETGEMEHQFLKEDGAFWKGLYFFNKAYRMGIFNPDGFTMKYAQYEEQIRNGTLLTEGFNWVQPDKEICGEMAIMTLLPGAFPVIPALYDMATPLGSLKGGARAINANCEYPERAMQLLNYFDSEDGARTLRNGIKGVDWDVVNGKAQYIGPRLEAIKEGKGFEYENEHPTGTGGDYRADALPLYWTSGEFKTSDDEPLALMSSEEMKKIGVSEAAKSFAQDFSPDFVYQGQAYEKWVNEGIAKTYTSYPVEIFLFPAMSTESLQAENKAAEYFAANIAKIIMAKDDTSFNTIKAEMIKDVRAMGLEASEAEFQKNYETAKTLVSSFTN